MHKEQMHARDRRGHPAADAGSAGVGRKGWDRHENPKEIIMAAKRTDLVRRMPPAGFEPALPP